MMYRLVFLILLLLLTPSWGDHLVRAQYFGASAVQLVTEPEFPAPMSTVLVSLDAYSMNTTGASIVWYVDGVERTDAKNERSLSVTTGALGETQEVKVKVTPINSFPLTASRVIVPTDVNIIIEANTYVPAFYRGRALPSSNAEIRVIAIPNIGSPEPLSSYTYEWRQGDKVLFGGPVKGKYAADIVMSPYEGDYVGVTVTDSKGRVVGGRTVPLPLAEPELHFYEENPLRGLSTRAIVDTLMLIGDETTIHGEPYFMATNLSRQSVTLDWSVDGRRVSTVEDPHVITLRRTGNPGSAVVNFNAVTTKTIPQYVQDAFTILF